MSPVRLDSRPGLSLLLGLERSAIASTSESELSLEALLRWGEGVLKPPKNTRATFLSDMSQNAGHWPVESKFTAPATVISYVQKTLHKFIKHP